MTFVDQVCVEGADSAAYALTLQTDHCQDAESCHWGVQVTLPS